MSLEKYLQDNYTHNELADLANHGAHGGFGDFIYYTDTVKYFETYKDDCFAEVNDYNESMGIFGFPKYIQDNMSEYHLFANSMIWFAIESIARRLTDGEYMKEVD